MSETNGTGIIYPTLELGGKMYTVKFTRGGLYYRMSKLGTSFVDLNVHGKNFSALIDCLHAALDGQYSGTPEDLAELVIEEQKLDVLGTVIAEALKKASPPKVAAEAVGNQAPQVQ